eukprot:1210898-Alexandrium_andersonii.AAC.1
MHSPARPLPPGRVAGPTASFSGGPLPAGRVGPFVGPAERSGATECLGNGGVASSAPPGTERAGG